MSVLIPHYDYKLDIDGQLILNPNGVQVITNEDMIRQHAKNLIMLNFKATEYMSLPNDQSTGLIIKEELSQLLENDPVFFAYGFTALVDVYPKDLSSIGFSVVLSNPDVQVDLGIEGFLNLRAGIMVGMGDFKLEPKVYSTNVKRVYERLHVTLPNQSISLTRPMVPGTQPFILSKANILGFENGLPIPKTTPDTGTCEVYPGLRLLPISDILSASGFMRVYNITLRQLDNTEIPSNQYSVVGTYLVFDGLTYTGVVNVEADLVEVAGDVSKYTETNGMHPVDIYPSARENKEYLLTLGGSMSPGDYFLIYDSFEVAT